MRLIRFILVNCLTIFVVSAGLASNLECAKFYLSRGPIGQLSMVQRTAGGSTGGKWMSDESGINWFMKRDVHYPELQTSAEPIASQVYRHFGFRTPDTVILDIGGVRYSASRDIGQYHSATDFSDMNTSEIRQMRVVAAYLKDWDRLGNPSNNRRMKDGSLIILDFGGTLGARAQGHHKSGAVFSDTIGSFEATTDINAIYSSFVVNASSSHPWMKINRADVEAVIQKFRLLTNDKIKEIVSSAQYSNREDHNYMIKALELRRDGIIKNLLGEFP